MSSQLQTRSVEPNARVGFTNLFLMVLGEVRRQFVRPSKLPVHIRSNGMHEEVICRVMFPFPRHPGTAAAGWRCWGWAHLGHVIVAVG